VSKSKKLHQSAIQFITVNTVTFFYFGSSPVKGHYCRGPDGFWTDSGYENSEICENNLTKNVQ